MKSLLYRFSPGFLRTIYTRIESSPLGYRLAHGAFWSLSGAGISRGLTLISSMVFARILGRQDFGKLGMIQSTVGMFGNFSGLGLGLTGTKFVAELRQTDPIRAGRIITLAGTIAAVTGLLSGVILFFLAPWMAAKTLAAPDLAGYLRIASLLLLFGAITSAQSGALSGFEAFKTIARVNLFAGVVAFPIMILAVWRWGLVGAVWGLVMSQVINWGLNVWALRSEAARWHVPIVFKSCFQEIRILGAFSLPAYLSSLLLGPASWFCATILAQLPNGYEELGSFNAANQMRLIILFLPNGIIGSALPVMTDLYSRGEHSSLKKLILTNLKLNSAITVTSAALAISLAPHIMAAYGSRFVAASGLLVILATVCVVDSVTNVFAYWLIGTNRIGTHLAFLVFWAVTLIVSSSLLVPRVAGKGLALAYLIAQLLYAVVLVSFYLVRFDRKSAAVT
ncbi:MAG: oligosaccharide flippase family protein [Candidatus Sumerlaeaceae bacterium]|nr:oligosaccharide flippase family protein [Candidatus Sumerlaeaceae bacterium]